MRIGVDIDGVLFPWEDAVADIALERFGLELGPMTSWDHYKGLLGSARWAWLWTTEGQAAVFGQIGRTYPKAVTAINALLKAGHRVHFVTHRDPRRASGATAEFLACHFGNYPWAGVHVIQNSVAKRTLGPWDVFIDDKPETVYDFLVNTGTMVFAPVRSWNVDELGDTGVEGVTNFIHYDDPADIVRWVEARA